MHYHDLNHHYCNKDAASTSSGWLGNIYGRCPSIGILSRHRKRQMGCNPGIWVMIPDMIVLLHLLEFISLYLEMFGNREHMEHVGSNQLMVVESNWFSCCCCLVCLLGHRLSRKHATVFQNWIASKRWEFLKLF